MPSITRRRFSGLAIAVAACTALPALPAFAQAQARGERSRVVFQVTEGDAAKWNLALNNVRNLQADLGPGASEVEVVAYGPAINLLKLDSPVAARVAEALADGVKVVACENTMKAFKLERADMLPDIGFVPAGVVELVRRQQQGWAYIRP